MPDVPALTRPLAQHEREMAVASLLDLSVGRWRDWIVATGDDAIPEELHQPLVEIVDGLGRSAAAADALPADGPVDPADTPAVFREYQRYLQAIALLSDSSLVWIIRAADHSPFPADL